MTEAQSAANKENAQKSTGPTSPAGKSRTRLNAYRHGLTGQIHLRTPEEQKAFEAHCKAMCEALDPVGVLEIDLAQSIAENRWRLMRVRAIESGIFAAGMQGDLGYPWCPPREDPAQADLDQGNSQARTWLTKAANLQLLALYEGRINRIIERNIAELCTRQAERKAARAQALEEAQLLAQLAHSKGEKYDATRDFPPELLGIGSDFSDAALTRLIVRNQRLAEARDFAKKVIRMPAAA